MLWLEESKDNINIILLLLNKAAGVITGGVTEVGVMVVETVDGYGVDIFTGNCWSLGAFVTPAEDPVPVADIYFQTNQ